MIKLESVFKVKIGPGKTMSKSKALANKAHIKTQAIIDRNIVVPRNIRLLPRLFVKALYLDSVFFENICENGKRGGRRFTVVNGFSY